MLYNIRTVRSASVAVTVIMDWKVPWFWLMVVLYGSLMNTGGFWLRRMFTINRARALTKEGKPWSKAKRLTCQKKYKVLERTWVKAIQFNTYQYSIFLFTRTLKNNLFIIHIKFCETCSLIFQTRELTLYWLTLLPRTFVRRYTWPVWSLTVNKSLFRVCDTIWYLTMLLGDWKEKKISTTDMQFL